jgi:fructose-1,6-bisphosphatase/inositol monophosphatase family enzyme
MNQKEFLDDALSIAETLARTAGNSALDLQSRLGQVDYKTPKDVVTKADYLSEKIIVEGLKNAFPTHYIRTEEAGIIQGEDPNYLWIIDPIDECFSRTVITSITTLFVCTVIAFMGGSSIRDFGLVMVFGIIVGTYSSIAVSSPFVVWWSKRFKGGL